MCVLSFSFPFPFLAFSSSPPSKKIKKGRPDEDAEDFKAPEYGRAKTEEFVPGAEVCLLNTRTHAHTFTCIHANVNYFTRSVTQKGI